jgi:ferrous iron transport protein A
MPQFDTLDRIPRGGRVSVLGIDGNSADDPIAQRLDDLGIRAGVHIEVIRRAPLGDPTVFELHGYQLCLRKSESLRVRVEIDPAETAPS